MSTSTTIGLGSYVEDNIHGYTGRVISVHLFAELPEDQEWVDCQIPAIEDEAQQPSYLWYSVLCHGGGSVLRPAYAINEIAPFRLDNSWSDKYFPNGGNND